MRGGHGAALLAAAPKPPRPHPGHGAGSWGVGQLVALEEWLVALVCGARCAENIPPSLLVEKRGDGKVSRKE